MSTQKPGGGFQKFVYNAQATALQGNIRKPYFQSLGQHAAVSTNAGSPGHSVARNNIFQVGGGDFSYGTAYSELNAFEDQGVYRTIVESTIENFSVGHGRLTADRIIARLESLYDPREYPHRKTPRILPIGSRFDNLRLDGEPIPLELPPAFFLTDGERDEFFAGQADADPRRQPVTMPASRVIDGFGTVYFAEWASVKQSGHTEQHLTMLRLSLGSTLGADAQGPSVQSDGSGWPP